MILNQILILEIICGTNSFFVLLTGLLVEEQIELALAQMTVTKSRSTAVDFLPTLFEGYQQIFLRHPSDGMNWNAFTEPFVFQTWIVIGSFIFLLPIILSALIFYGKTQYVGKILGFVSFIG